jgi:hypothetical protein
LSRRDQLFTLEGKKEERKTHQLMAVWKTSQTRRKETSTTRYLRSDLPKFWKYSRHCVSVTPARKTERIVPMSCTSRRRVSVRVLLFERSTVETEMRGERRGRTKAPMLLSIAGKAGGALILAVETAGGAGDEGELRRDEEKRGTRERLQRGGEVGGN